VAKKPTELIKTIAYLRVSTKKQADYGVSLKVQREKVIAYCKVYDLDLVEIIKDRGKSGKDLNRPLLQKALEKLRTKEVKALLVMKLDRLTRSVVDLGQLIEDYFAPGARYGAILYSVTEHVDTSTAGGRFALNMQITVNQWEREVISERTVSAMSYKKSKGEYTGGDDPYGFKSVQGQLHVNDSEQAVIRRAKVLHKDGLSLRGIAAQLNKEEMRSRNGCVFQANQIKRILDIKL